MVRHAHINISFDNLIFIRFRNYPARNCGSGFSFGHCVYESRNSLGVQIGLLENRQLFDFVDADVEGREKIYPSGTYG
jgi:hypothetical protein